MKKIDITIDLTQEEDKIWKQIDKAEKKINNTPWYKRIFSWF